MRNPTLLTLAFLFARLSIEAQELKETATRTGSSNFYISNGIHVFSFGSINEHLATSGYPLIKESHGSTGFGGFGTLGKIILGGEGFSMSSSASNDTATTISESGLGIFYFGYKIVSKKFLSVYPMTGIGFGGTSVRLSQLQPDMAFANFLRSPLNSGDIGMGNALVNVCLAMDYKLQEKNTMFIGLRAGYNFSGKSSWQASNFRIVNGPEDRVSNIFILLNVGVSIGN